MLWSVYSLYFEGNYPFILIFNLLYLVFDIILTLKVLQVTPTSLNYGTTLKLTIWLMMWPGGCFTNVSQALQNILSKSMYCRNCTSYGNFKLKLCTCAQSHALGTCTKFQLEILLINVISVIVYFREIILESSRNVSETTSWFHEDVITSKHIPYSGAFVGNIPAADGNFWTNGQ